MKSIKQMNLKTMVENSQLSKQSVKQQAPGLTDRNASIVERFWIVMAELYSHQWASAQGVEPTERWINALTHYDTQLTAKFILMCETGKHFVDYPPSVRDFHIFCSPSSAAFKPFDFKQMGNQSEKIASNRIKEMRTMSQDDLKKISRVPHEVAANV